VIFRRHRDSSSSSSDECRRRNRCENLIIRRCRDSSSSSSISSSSSSCEREKRRLRECEWEREREREREQEQERLRRCELEKRRERERLRRCEREKRRYEDLICFKKNDWERKLREGNGKYIHLIQEVIAQGVASSVKLAQGFTNEIVRHLGTGVRGVLKSSENRACEELNRVEHKILEIIRRYSDEILHELDDLVTNTNHDLLDNIITLIKRTGIIIRDEIDRLPISGPPNPGPGPPPPGPPTIELIPTVAIVNKDIADFIAELIKLFEKATNTKKGLLNRILLEKKNRIIKDITHELRNFRDFINHLFEEVQASESKLINSTFDQSSKKLIIELDGILSQVGSNIINIIKGCNTSLRIPLAISPAVISTTYAPSHLVQ
jgi:hypothetical protein